MEIEIIMNQLNEVQQLQEAVQEVNPTVIEKFLQQLPEKAFNLGIRVLLTLVFFLIGILIIKWIRKLVKKTMKRAKVETGAIQFMDSLLKIVLYGFLVLTIAMRYGFDATSIVAILGSAGLAIGLSIQGSLSNLAGGVLILLFKPFKVGDYIIEDNKNNEGIVTEIQLFYTLLHTVDNKVVVIPNGTLANNSMTNLTKMKDRQLDLRISVSYRSDLKKAKEILYKILKEDPLVNEKTDPVIFVDDLGDNAVILGMRAWVKTDDYFKLKWRVLETIKLSFDENGIEIPYPQMDIHFDRKISTEK